jgi:hypothetical protein
MADKLLGWRRSVEKKFRFDPAKAGDPCEILRVEQEVLMERRRLEERLRTGFAELQANPGANPCRASAYDAAGHGRARDVFASRGGLQGRPRSLEHFSIRLGVA